LPPLLSFLTEIKIFAFSFALMQKKQKIKENPIAPHVFPCLHTAKASGSYAREGMIILREKRSCTDSAITV
jgi:hypothetical protein